MCGISGILNRSSESIFTSHLVRMNDSQSHRGPDGKGFLIITDKKSHPLLWRGGNHENVGLPDRKIAVGLAHNWLAIQDQNPLAQQPILSKGSRYWLVYNGEIYNFHELRTELEKKGYQFDTKSDTEVLLSLWVEYGEESVYRLRGMFAFLIYDSKEETLWAVRDRFGIKPLYYAKIFRSKGMLFSSEIRALHASRLVKKKLHEENTLAFLAAAVNKPDITETIYEDVFEVPPGQIIKIRGNEIESHSYYRLEAPRAHFTNHQHKKAIDKLRESFLETISIHLRSCREIGTCLSGGLDSTNIAYAIHQLIGEKKSRFKAFTFGDADHQDVQLAKLASQRIDFDHICYSSHDELLIDDLIDLIRICEIPNHTWGPINQHLLIKNIHENHPLPVLMDGQGGDEVFSGYPWYIAVFESFIREQHNSETAERFVKEFNRRLPLPELIFKATLQVYFSKKKWIQMFDQGATHLLSLSMDDILSLPATVFYLNDLEDWPAFRYRELYHRELQHFLRQTDRIGMWHSIENRVPYVDHELVGLIGTFDPLLLFHKGYYKYPLRVLFPKIPNRVRFNTNKVGFWETYSTLPDLKPRLESLISASTFLSQFVRDINQVDQLGDMALWRFFQIAVLDS